MTEKKTLEEKTSACIATLEVGLVDQAARGDIIDVLKEWIAREELLRQPEPATNQT